MSSIDAFLYYIKKKKKKFYNKIFLKWILRNKFCMSMHNGNG